jgi:threonine aldolase
VIDLRSDTVTRPTDAMRAAMVTAVVGDDVYAEDPTVQALEERVADLFGREAALFCTTGTLANVLAVRSVVPRGGELICEAEAHLVRAELGSHAVTSGITTRTWSAPRGLLDLDAIERLVAPDLGPYFLRTAAVAVENTHNFGGGSVQPAGAVEALRVLADRYGFAVHLDGARLWNAAVATGRSLRDLAAGADSLSVCLSKGLGAPVGSLMVGTADQVAEARIWRKRLGSGWRQAGILAAAGLHALDHHVDRLADDHAHARLLAQACEVDPATVDTNIVVVPCRDAVAAATAARAEGVLVGAVGARTLRLVTHLDVSADDARAAGAVLARVLRQTAA